MAFRGGFVEDGKGSRLNPYEPCGYSSQKPSQPNRGHFGNRGGGGGEGLEVMTSDFVLKHPHCRDPDLEEPGT